MKYSNVTVEIAIAGDGRNDRVQIAPISPTSFSTTSPPGALSQTSPDIHGEFPLVGGNNSVVGPGATFNLANLINAGFSPQYVIVVPPSNSVNAKTLKGASGDTGIVLVPQYPLVLALPTAGVSTWQVVINSAGSETVEVWII